MDYTRCLSNRAQCAQFAAKAREEAKLVFQPETGGGAGEDLIRGALTTPPPCFEEGLERLVALITRLGR